MERDHIIENNSKLDDHVLLKAYYKKSTSDYGINFDIIALILKKIVKASNEGILKLWHEMPKFQISFFDSVDRVGSYISAQCSRNYEFA